MKKQTLSQKKIVLLCISAFLSALSIVLGKYLAINLGDTIRLSFENLPILFAGLYFGPIMGICVGVTADLVGCVLVGFTINPIITLGAALIGFTAGICKKLMKQDILSIVFSVLLAHLFGSVITKTIGLFVFYKMPFFATLGLRSLTYLCISLCEILILCFLSKSSALTNETQKILKKGK